MELVGGLIGAAGLFLLVWSLGRRNAVDTDPINSRLRVYEAPVASFEAELEAPFRERVIDPVLQRASRLIARQTTDVQREKLHYQLLMAGRRSTLTPEAFVAIRFGTTFGLFCIGLLLGVALGNVVVIALGAAVGAGLGLWLPGAWLKQQVGNRRTEIGKALPDAMDLLTISVEAGLSFDQSMDRLAAKFKNALSQEFTTTLTEIRLGRPRYEALDEMGRRCGVDDLHNFIQSLIQSDMMGIPIAKILRLQSEEIRRKRRQRAQEKAAQATLKMMLPMVGCIFPTIWIVLLGPAVLILLAARG